MFFKAILIVFFIDISTQFTLYFIYNNLLAKRLLERKR